MPTANASVVFRTLRILKPTTVTGAAVARAMTGPGASRLSLSLRRQQEEANAGLPVVWSTHSIT